MEENQMSNNEQERAILEEIQGQLDEVQREETNAESALARIRGKRDALIHLKSRIFNGMVPGFGDKGKSA